MYTSTTFERRSNARSHAPSSNSERESDLPGPPHEELQQGELLDREIELSLAAPGTPRGRIQTEIADLDDGGALAGYPPDEGAQPRQQLLERERLDEVVVGARIQAVHAILDRVTRRQHEHRAPDPELAQPPADLETVRAGEHDVEHDRVVGSGAGHPERVLAALGDIDRVALLAQAAGNHVRQLRLVFDHQHAHRAHCRAPP